MDTNVEDKDFKEGFQRQYDDLKKKAKKNKKKYPDVSVAYEEEAAKLKERYETKSPELIQDLQQWHALREMRDAIYKKLPSGQKPK